MKTYTLEELRLAQAKGCRIEFQLNNRKWIVLNRARFYHVTENNSSRYRIHPADGWKARLPRLADGAEWCCKGDTFPFGHRPHVIGEHVEGTYALKAQFGFGYSTAGPVPPEFLHESEIAREWCPMCAAYTDHGSGACPQLAEQPEATPPAPAPDYGEPWEPSCEMIFDRDGDYVAEFQPPFHDNSKITARAIACVNAMAGIPDPAAFVAQAREMREVIKEAHDALNKSRACLQDWSKIPESESQTSDAKALIGAGIALAKLQPFIL